ncbi:MAG: hypothetical protein JSU96_20500 [Acidobacteriota bacterium]|nr:MAG: hypothetical protein JSU96_20500 [Acidobacteriota bacterium]
MVVLQLNETEAVSLKEILSSYLSDLRMEIADTDSMNFREGLKKRELFLKDLIGQLSKPHSKSSSSPTYPVSG